METTGQLHAPATLLPRKEHPVPIGYDAGQAPEQVWMLWSINNLTPTGNQTSAIQPVARHYIEVSNYKYGNDAKRFGLTE
jgi:hypothetical protein